MEVTCFGTDGIRGVANTELSADLALAFGRAVARVLPSEVFVMGRDTRRSGYMLQSAVAAGIASEGSDVLDAGVMPTPGVAWMSAERNLPAVVVSASHNPFYDNGLKLFAAGGSKVPEDLEAEVAGELRALMDAARTSRQAPSGHGVGTVIHDPSLREGYLGHLLGAIEGRSLEGLHLLLDAANGAASSLAPQVFSMAGAEVTAIGCEPDGSNINDGCGSTHPAALAREVVDHGADLGLAFDGDADRLVAVDHRGAVATGDELMVIFASDLAERDQLPGRGVVVTVMSNLGLHVALGDLGISVRTTGVGDRHVAEALDAAGLAFGGEQSGHLVFRRWATTGDGMLTGLLLADLVKRSGRKLADLVAASMTRVPQVLVNIGVDSPSLLDSAEVASEVEALRAELGDSGRVLVRPSGTEPLVRVMVEALDEDVARAAAERLSAVLVRVAAQSP